MRGTTLQRLGDPRALNSAGLRNIRREIPRRRRTSVTDSHVRSGSLKKCIPSSTRSSPATPIRQTQHVPHLTGVREVPGTSTMCPERNVEHVPGYHNLHAECLSVSCPVSGRKPESRSQSSTQANASNARGSPLGRIASVENPAGCFIIAPCGGDSRHDGQCRSGSEKLDTAPRNGRVAPDDRHAATHPHRPPPARQSGIRHRGNRVDPCRLHRRRFHRHQPSFCPDDPSPGGAASGSGGDTLPRCQPPLRHPRHGFGLGQIGAGCPSAIRNRLDHHAGL